MAPRKEITLSIHSFLLLALFAIGLGSFYRLPGLERRPMHTDEAILAVKAGEFWNSGQFDYDPRDYHGPALHQVTWLWGHLADRRP
jgi:predicted membrane-bound mannosyltransferase